MLVYTHQKLITCSSYHGVPGTYVTCPVNTGPTGNKKRKLVVCPELTLEYTLRDGSVRMWRLRTLTRRREAGKSVQLHAFAGVTAFFLSFQRLSDDELFGLHTRAVDV